MCKIKVNQNSSRILSFLSISLMMKVAQALQKIRRFVKKMIKVKRKRTLKNQSRKTLLPKTVLKTFKMKVLPNLETKLMIQDKTISTISSSQMTLCSVLQIHLLNHSPTSMEPQRHQVILKNRTNPKANHHLLDTKPNRPKLDKTRKW